MMGARPARGGRHGHEEEVRKELQGLEDRQAHQVRQAHQAGQGGRAARGRRRDARGPPGARRDQGRRVEGRGEGRPGRGRGGGEEDGQAREEAGEAVCDRAVRWHPHHERPHHQRHHRPGRQPRRRPGRLLDRRPAPRRGAGARAHRDVEQAEGGAARRPDRLRRAPDPTVPTTTFTRG
ncbi:hypothetical protein NOCARDAX2BIS_120072 [Nocardioides sp. AX2bis]|nr:hypothetical protein NOCARDAX2BIS_120072 [Nocardioides sp. AX2bis]